MKKYHEDIEYFLALLKSNKHFALSRYGDGEWMAINSTACSPGAGEWQINPVDPRTEQSRADLEQSLKYKHKDYYLGICPCYTDMLLGSNQPASNVTYANIFCNKNYEIFKTKYVEVFKEKQIVLVCNKNAVTSNLPFIPDTIYHVEDNAWIENYDLYDKIINDRHHNKVFLFAAGPLSKILVSKLWMVDQSNTYIDIGSSLDEYIGNLHHPRAYYLGQQPYCSLVCPCPNYIPPLTFIIPSLGRTTLRNSLESLINQTNQNWKCHVGLDGLTEDRVDKSLLIDDPRIQYHYFEERIGVGGEGTTGQSGSVRNNLMNMEKADWYAFLDDDDTISMDYVDRFNRSLSQNPGMDMYIFRMIFHSRYGYHIGHTIPPLDVDDPYTLSVGQVGISFCVRGDFVRNNKLSFHSSCVEDIQFIHQFVENRASIVLSDIVGYYVGGRG